GGRALRARPPATAQGILLNLTRATIALAFYRRTVGGFSGITLRANIPAFRGKPAHDFPCPQSPRLSHRKDDLQRRTCRPSEPPLLSPASFFMCPGRSVCLHSHRRRPTAPARPRPRPPQRLFRTGNRRTTATAKINIIIAAGDAGWCF